MIHKPSTKGMIRDINSMRSRAIKLLEGKPVYSSLLIALTKTDYFKDEEDVRFPLLKYFAAEAGIPDSTSRKHLKKIYHDLCSEDPSIDNPFVFKEVEYLFFVSCYNGSRTFKVKNLPVQPRKGESIRVPYFNEFTGTDMYYVKEIDHFFKNEIQEIYIYLTPGIYNEYWSLRIAQAIATGEIAWEDVYRKNEDQLRTMLDVRSGNVW